MTLAVPDGAVTIDPHQGNLRGLRFWDGRKWLDPLHFAGLDRPERDGLPPVRRKTAGDFLSGSTGGWTADSPWQVREVVQSGGAALARLSLGRFAQGATVEKELSLRQGEPILYQSHLLQGGQGELTLAHHPLVRMARGGRLSFSPKSHALTNSALSEAACEGPVDLRHSPNRTEGEDLVTLVEAAGNPLGWTAVLRHAEQDIVFILRDPELLPVTTLSYSHGGGVLGIGDGCAPGADGEMSSAAHTVRHALGAVPCPEGWTHVTEISIDQNTLRLAGDGERVLWLPFDGRFFARGT